MPSPNCLIIFTRYPEPGSTKTRLIPALGASGAAKLQKMMSEFVLLEAQNLQSLKPLDIQINYLGGNLKLVSDWLGENLNYKPQIKGSLGEKMSAAFTEAFAQGYTSAVIIGTDCPNLDKNILHQAFDLLDRNDMVLGSATDGGYYLIGLNQPVPALFYDIPWSTSEVCDRTISIANKLDLKIGYLPQLFDIDLPEDLLLIKNNIKYQQFLHDFGDSSRFK